ncbi:MAG: MerR family transcriptional regulator [Bryobacteraceae bacterium]|nr:MerR family transcriptional regulator [Bryobacteraceae bacterium]
MATHATAPATGSAPTTPEIPNKLYFRIGDVSQIAGVKPYVLRYWETEFPAIGPRKSGSNHRLYRRKDVELILDIKRLLYQERYTIEGARKHLEAQHKAEVSARSKKGRSGEVAPSPMPPASVAPALSSPMGVFSGSTLSGAAMAKVALPELSVRPAHNLSAIRAELRAILELLR